MLKKTITYYDFDDNQVTEDFYFNLNKAEIAEMELERKGGLNAYVQDIIKADERGELIKIFKQLIIKSVGKRSEDGKLFIKNEQVTNEFIQTNAYSEFFYELSSNEQSALEFMRGLVPKDLEGKLTDEAVAKATAEINGTTTVELPADDEPAWLKERRTPTPEEVKKATPEQLQKAFSIRAENAVADK